MPSSPFHKITQDSAFRPIPRPDLVTIILDLSEEVPEK